MNDQTRAALRMEPNPLQRALDNYQELERQWQAAKRKADELNALNAGLLAENGVLREALRTSDHDRVRLQAIASTLMGRLLAINDTIAGAVRAAVRDGIEASEAIDTENEPAEPVREIPARPLAQTPEPRKAPPEAPQRPTAAILQEIQYRR